MTTTVATPHAAVDALRCPRCAAEMVSYARSGVVLEQCRDCRGMFLDRGELECLVDAESGGAGWTGPQMAPSPSPLPRGGEGWAAGLGLDPRQPGYRSEWYDHDGDARRHRRGDWDERGQRDGHAEHHTTP